MHLKRQKTAVTSTNFQMYCNIKINAYNFAFCGNPALANASIHFFSQRPKLMLTLIELQLKWR